MHSDPLRVKIDCIPEHPRITLCLKEVEADQLTTVWIDHRANWLWANYLMREDLPGI